MALNSRLLSRRRDPLEDRLNELMGVKKVRSSKGENRVLKGHEPFDATRLISFVIMALIAASISSVISGFVFTLAFPGTPNAMLVAGFISWGVGMFVFHVADAIIPESKEIQRERIRQQKKALGLKF